MKEKRKLKGYKTIFIFMLGLLLFFGAFRQANYSGLLDFLIKTGTEVAGGGAIDLLDLAKGVTGGFTGKKEHITDEIFESANDSVSMMYAAAMETCASIIISPFGPDFDMFRAMIGATSTTQIQHLAMGFGYLLITIIFMFSILKMMISTSSSGEESRFTPGSLVIRTLIASFCVVNQAVIINNMTHLMSTLWNAYIASPIKGGAEQSIILTYFNDIFDIEDTSCSILGVSFNCSVANPLLWALLLLLKILLSYKLLKELFGLFTDTIMHYIIFCMIMMFFPATVATVVSPDTEGVFKSYITMVFSQVILLFVDAIFISLGIYVMSMYVVGDTGETITFAARYIFLMGFLKAGRKFDGYLRQMGLSPSVTGSNLLASARGAGGNLMRNLGELNRARHGIGNALSAVGLANSASKDPTVAKRGDSLRKAGNTIKASLNDVAKDLMNNEKYGKDIPDIGKYAGLGEAGMVDHQMDMHTAKNILGSYLNNPDDSSIKNAVKSIPDNKIAEALSDMTGENIQRATINNRRGGFDVQGYGADGTKMSGILDKNGLTYNKGTVSTGDSYKWSKKDGGVSSMQQAGIFDVMKDKDLGVPDEDIGGIKVGKNGARIFDSAGQTIGTVKDGVYAANSSYSSVDGDVGIEDKNNLIQGEYEGSWAKALAEEMGLGNLNVGRPEDGNDSAYVEFISDKNKEGSWHAIAYSGGDVLCKYTVSDSGQYLSSRVKNDDTDFVYSSNRGSDSNHSFVFNRVTDKNKQDI